MFRLSILACFATLVLAFSACSSNGGENGGEIEDFVSSSSDFGEGISSSEGISSDSDDGASLSSSDGASSGSDEGISSGSVEYSSSGSEEGFTFGDVQFWVGEGENKALLIIQWNDEKTSDALVWGYKWNGEKYGIDMVMDIAKTDPKFFAMVFYSGPYLGYAIGGMGYDISGNNSFELSNGSHQAIEEGLAYATSYDFDDWICSDSEAHWAAGWYVNGFWSYWVKENIADEFKFSGLGTSSRILQNGSVDLWYFGSLDIFFEDQHDIDLKDLTPATISEMKS